MPFKPPAPDTLIEEPQSGFKPPSPDSLIQEGSAPSKPPISPETVSRLQSQQAESDFMRQNYSGREANTGLTTAIAEKGSDAGKWLGETLASGAKSQWDTIKAISDKIPSLPKTVSEPVVRALKESAEEVAGNLGAGPALKRTIGGAAQGTGETAAGFVSPAALAGGGAIKAGGTLAQLAKRAFAAQMVSQAPEAYAQAVHAVKYGNESDISRSLVNLASATALPLAIVHAELTGKSAPMMSEGAKPITVPPEYKALLPRASAAVENPLPPIQTAEPAAETPKPEGEPHASSQPSATSTTQPEVRPPVGETSPLRQQGEAPGAPPQDVRPPGAGEVPKVAAIFTKDNPPPLYSKAMWKGEEVEIATGVGMDGKVRVQGFIHDQRVPVEELQSIQSEVAAPPAAPAVANPLPSPEPIPEKPVGAKSAQTRQRNKAGGVQSPTSAPKSVFESLDDIDAAVAAKKITPAQAVKARNALLKKSGQKPPEEPPTPGITSMGGLAPSDPTEPAGKGLPSVEELLAGGGGTATRPATPTTAQGFMASMRDAFSGQRFSQAFKGWLGGMAGETMPKTTVQDRLSGELGARFLSSPIAARHVAEVFAGDVLGADVDPNQFGAALSEDNLRSIKAGLPPEEAENVFSFIGKEDSPFATEKEYQAYLQQPEVKAAIARHKENWTNIVEPMYREAMKIDPDEELPSRGQQTGARVNLNANPDEKTDIVTTQPRGNLMGTLTKKSPFGRKAYGSGKNYGMNYTDLMHQTFTRQLEIANKNAFEAQLVKSGNAKIAKPGLRDLTLGDGSATKEVPLKRQTIIKDGKPIPVNRSLYIRQNLASEYLTAANVHPNQFAEKINGALNKFINTSALAGLTDASVHVSNLSSALLTRPGPGNIIRDSLLSLFGRADIPLTIARTLRKAVADNSTQTAALAEMGALKGGSPSKGRLLGRVSNFIQRADKTVRLSLDDVYKSLVAQGLQENTETTRREFVNQVGQYSKRAQGPFVRFLRDSGFGPFVTAGRTFNTLGFRMATLNPGGKATSPSAAAIMRLNLASKWIGTAVFIGGLNYLFTGKPGGRPGTPIGTVDTGKDTDEGKPITVPVARMFGLDRAMRVTGLKGFANAKALGLDTTTALDSAGRDVINAAISPAAGPPVRLGVGAATGYSPAVRVGRQFPVVAPGQSQFVSDAKNALLEANPIAGTIHAAMQPNANVLDAARRSFPSFAPQAGKAPDMVANYPRIVSRAQLNDYITDVAKRARGMSSEARSEYLKQSADSVPDDLKKDFWAQMKRIKVQ